MNKKRTFTIYGSIITLSISLLAGFLPTEMHAGESTSESAKAMKPLKVFILAGQSNEGFHYLGSVYIYGKIGKVFAEGMAKMVK
jgi:hypothetical protein